MTVVISRQEIPHRIRPDHNSIFKVQDVSYLIQFSTQDLKIDNHPEFSLAAVFLLEQPSVIITESWIQHQIKIYTEEDDVFQEEFLEGVILVSDDPNRIEIADKAREYLQSLGTKWVHVLAHRDGECIRNGPYVLLDQYLREVWKLRSDTNGTLLTAIQPKDQRSFTKLEVPVDNNGFLQVAVTSRMKTLTTPEKPLAGVRIVVKDNFHLKGLKTSLCNRAYYDTYPPSSETAVCIQTLVDLGAIVLGQAKLNSFGAWEEPTEYIDYQAPWNPRGDGYQSPGGSSTGSAAAIAAYDWLDIAIGSDTGGSVFRPAIWCGCFSVRPTFDALSVEGFVTCIRLIDMPGFFGRDLAKCRDFAAHWYANDLPAPQSKPVSRFIWPTEFWADMGLDQTTMAKNFVNDFEAFLNVKHVELSFSDEWGKSPPKEAQGLSMKDYMDHAPDNLWYDGYHSMDDFRERYLRIYGKEPYIGPAIRQDWAEEKPLTKEMRDQAVIKHEVHRQWFLKNIMGGEDSNTIVIVPVENLIPRYRDEPPKFVKGHGVACSYLSASIGAPQLVVPIGQLPYNSKVSGRKEYLPMAVGVLAYPGNDLGLLDVVYEFLKNTGRPTKVQTGRFTFPEER